MFNVPSSPCKTVCTHFKKFYFFLVFAKFHAYSGDLCRPLRLHTPLVLQAMQDCVLSQITQVVHTASAPQPSTLLCQGPPNRLHSFLFVFFFFCNANLPFKSDRIINSLIAVAVTEEEEVMCKRFCCSLQGLLKIY